MHEIQVYADSVYAAIGDMQEFRADSMLKRLPGSLTEFTVTVHRPPTTQRVNFGKVIEWAQIPGKTRKKH